MRKLLFAISIFVFISGISENTIAATEKGIIGLTVIKDDVNPFQYELGRFVINTIENTNLSHHSSYQSITAFLNEMNIGKHIVDKLLGYNLNNGMSLDSLSQRIPFERRQHPTEADYEAALINNYILVIKMDAESIKRIQQGDTVKFTPQGECFLYQIDLTPETSEAIQNNLFTSKDNDIERGEKRFVYEGISILLKLVNSNIDITPKGVKNLLNSVQYISYHDVEKGIQSNKKGKVSTALKIALSPLIILK